MSVFWAYSPVCVPGRPAPKYVPTSVGRWNTCGSPWTVKMWTQCWRSWAYVSTGSSMSIYSNTATAQWEACWPSATWLNTDDAPRTSGWAGGHRSRMHWSQGKHGSAYKGSYLRTVIEEKGSGHFVRNYFYTFNLDQITSLHIKYVSR